MNFGDDRRNNWGSNTIYRDHSPLFQAEADVVPVPHYYFDDSQERVTVEYKDGLAIRGVVVLVGRAV